MQNQFDRSTFGTCAAETCAGPGMRALTLRRVLHHLTLWVPDLERAAPSWRWLLGDHLGYEVDDQADVNKLLFRDGDGFTLVLEQSVDMVPGMLHSRLRPGLNHVAFTIGTPGALDSIVAEAGHYGWSTLPGDRHPIAGASTVVYLEDRDGFEVELVAPDQP
jgi:catechol 2,3-dioxygenase-like lactoylglutathione lyase family enzyme